MKRERGTATQKKDDSTKQGIAYLISTIVIICILISVVVIGSNENESEDWMNYWIIDATPCSNINDARILTGFQILSPTFVPPRLDKIAIRINDIPDNQTAWIVFSSKEYGNEPINAWKSLADGSVILVEEPFYGDSVGFIKNYTQMGNTTDFSVNGASGVGLQSQYHSLARNDLIWISNDIRFTLISIALDLSDLKEIGDSITG